MSPGPPSAAWAVWAAAAALVATAGCGAANATKPRLVVSAASSLKEALTSCAPAFRKAQVRLSFAGSDELAAQIRRGVRPDVFAAANSKLPERLAREGLVDRPVVFATNELVLAVPAAGARVRSLADAGRPGTRLAVGSPSVPVGGYTREVLSRLPPGMRAGILHNVRSSEPDVKGVVGKVAHRAVDAGFVYASDVQATGGRLRAIHLPMDLRPTVRYGAAVVTKGPQPRLAREYLAGLRAGPCADALQRAGLGPPPR